MAIYNFNLALIVIMFLYSRISKSITKSENVEFGSKIIFLSLWLVSGLRNMVGTDFINYENYFYNIDFYSWDFPLFERGYFLLNYIVSIFTDQSQYIFLTTSFIIIYLINKTLENYSVSYYFSVFLFVTMYFYYESFNIVRQYIVIAMLFYSLKYILNRDLRKFTLLILTATMFHATAIIMYPFYWISRKRFSNVTYGVMVGATFGLSFITPILVNIASIFVPKLSVYSHYVMEGASANTVIIITAVVLLFAFVYKKRLLSMFPDSNILLNLVFFGFLFTILSRENILFYRVALYFHIFILLLIPICIKASHIYARVLATLASLVVFTSYHYYLLSNNNAAVLPYKYSVELTWINPVSVMLLLTAIFVTVMFRVLLKAVIKKRKDEKKIFHNIKVSQ